MLCNSINKDCSILIAGWQNQIKVFEFTQRELEQVQKLSEHKDQILTLKFMKKSDQFISGSGDPTIIIWERNINNSWVCQQKLNGHKGSIQCLLLNNYEDIIVSGSNDNQIKFRQNQSGWLCSQTINNHTKIINGLSFNENKID